MFLLTDGRVLAQDATLTDVAWWTLTPDYSGSYSSGTWKKVASPPKCPNGFPGASADTVYSPEYYASAVLPDGRFIMIGGEYNYNYDYVLKDGSGQVDTDQGAIYDPVADSWTCIAPPTGAWAKIGDAQSVVLPDGTFMIANIGDDEVVTLNLSTNPPTYNPSFTPTGKTGDPSPGLKVGCGPVPCNDEEGWSELANGKVLTLEIWNPADTTSTPALTYDSSTKAWSGAGTAPDPLVLLTIGGVGEYEIGPAILRPDGTVFASGATGFNDVYNTGSGLWSKAPAFPTLTDTVAPASVKRNY